MNEEEKLREYIQPARSIVWVIILGMCVYVLIYATTANIKVMIGFALLTIIFLLIYTVQFCIYMHTVNNYKRSGLWKEAAVDFYSSASYMDDKLRLGEQYLFINHSCKIISYQDMHYVFLVNDGGGDHKCLKIKLNNGKKIKVYYTACFSVVQEALSTMTQAIEEKNPTITIDSCLKTIAH